MTDVQSTLPNGDGAERRVVVDVAGLRAALADHLVRELVELEQVDADVGGVRRGAVSTSATKRPAGRICSIWEGLRSSITPASLWPGGTTGRFRV